MGFFIDRNVTKMNVQNKLTNGLVAHGRAVYSIMRNRRLKKFLIKINTATKEGIENESRKAKSTYKKIK